MCSEICKSKSEFCGLVEITTTEATWKIKSSSEVSQYIAELELEACAPVSRDQVS